MLDHAQIVKLDEIPPETHGGRPPKGWCGGAQIVEQVKRLEPGTAYRFNLPRKVSYDTFRNGVYRVARDHSITIHIRRHGRKVSVWSQP